MSAAHTKGPYTVHVVKVESPLIAAMELSQLVHGTKYFSGVLPMVVGANALCVAVTGCGPDGLENANLFSAATEMLASLQAVSASAPDDIGTAADGAVLIAMTHEEVRNLRAAIAKATGSTK